MNPVLPILLSSLLLFSCDSSDTIPATDGMPISSPSSLKSEIEVVQRYLNATQGQADRLKGVAMEIDIDAKLPKLNKEGKFHALRHISKLGQISYLAQAFTGDNTIKKDVIARYLSAETQAKGDATGSIGITPENYKFKYKGLTEKNGNKVRVLQVTPRKKRVGLFKGEIWLDATSYLPVREEGRFVKNPSVFLKKVEFVREYEIMDGIAVPKHIESVIETRLVGKAELSIGFSKFSHVENDVIFANGGDARPQPTP